MSYDLVFEGGGAKGMVFIGAMQAFEEQNHQFDRLLGTSAGAITATLLAAGYDSVEMLGALNEEAADGRPIFETFLGIPTQFADEQLQTNAILSLFREIDVPGIPNFIEDKVDEAVFKALIKSQRFRYLFSFVELGGIYSADAFVDWFKRKLDSGEFQGEKRRFSDLNLAGFYAATGRELSLIASDTTDGRLLVLNHITAPDCPVAYAVRMSMSVPFLWHEVKWRAEWGRYRRRDIAGNAIVDGGLLSNFPIELFLSDRPQVTAVMGARKSNKTLGFLIDESLPLTDNSGEGDDDGADDQFNFGDLVTVQRLTRFINTVTQAHDKMAIEEFADLVVRLPAKGYATTDFGMSDHRRQALIDAGREVAKEYFSQKAAELTPKGIDEAASQIDKANRMAERMLAQ